MFARLLASVTKSILRQKSVWFTAWKESAQSAQGFIFLRDLAAQIEFWFGWRLSDRRKSELCPESIDGDDISRLVFFQPIEPFLGRFSHHEREQNAFDVRLIRPYCRLADRSHNSSTLTPASRTLGAFRGLIGEGVLKMGPGVGWHPTSRATFRLMAGGVV
jgi:hypothetical protein